MHAYHILGPAAVTRVVNQILANQHCNSPGLTLLSMDSVYGVKVGDEDIPGAISFHSKLDDWILYGKPLGSKRKSEVMRACPGTYQRIANEATGQV